MNNTWIPLNSFEQLEKINLDSTNCPQIIYKHSTRCHICSWAYKELESFTLENKGNYAFYYLDILKHRDISNEVSKVWGIIHESPQIIIIRNNVSIFSTSHEGITKEEIAKKIV